MTEILIREASSADAPVVANFVRLMLEEMALMGGHRITESDEEWKRFAKKRFPGKFRQQKRLERRISKKDICIKVCANSNVSCIDIRGKKRDVATVAVRYMAMRKMMAEGYCGAEIARFFNCSAAAVSKAMKK